MPCAAPSRARARAASFVEGTVASRWTMAPTGMAVRFRLSGGIGERGQVLAELLPPGLELFEPGPVLRHHGGRGLGHEVGVPELALDLLGLRVDLGQLLLQPVPLLARGRPACPGRRRSRTGRRRP